jgi:DNA-binding NtrC family response regulator
MPAQRTVECRVPPSPVLDREVVREDFMAKQIFVVDDEKCIADSLAMILRKSGFETRAFYNAHSALAQIESSTPELVISDVVMPVMSGLEMAVLIRERLPECRILLFSGKASTLNILEIIRHRGYDFDLLAKPVHPADLLATATGAVHKSEGAA